MINDIAIDVASQIGPETTYDTALCLLRKEMQKKKCQEKINRNIDVQSMLVHCDPSVNTLKNKLLEAKCFYDCFKIFLSHDWIKTDRQFSISLDKEKLTFPNKRSCMIFCYHKDIVPLWKSMKHAPKKIKVSTKNYTFRTEKTMTEEECQKLWKEMLNNRLPEDVLWGDLMMESDEDN